MEILWNYSFLTVAIGTVLLATASALIGTITVLTKQSLIGDMVGHATYPGVVLAFMIFHTRHPLILMIGAICFGHCSMWLLQFTTRYSNHSTVNAMALISSSFFGLGIALKQYIQGHEAFYKVSQTGLQHYLFGQAAFIQREDIWFIAIISLACIIVFILYYERLRIYLFSPTYAKIIGIQTRWLEHLTRICMIAVISAGLKMVGVVLVSSFLVAPAILGLNCAKTYRKMIVVAVVSASGAALFGTLTSSIHSRLSTGATIIVVMTSMVLVALMVRRLRTDVLPGVKRGEENG